MFPWARCFVNSHHLLFIVCLFLNNELAPHVLAEVFVSKTFPTYMHAELLGLERENQRLLCLNNLARCEWCRIGLLLRVMSEMNLDVHVFCNPFVDIKGLLATTLREFVVEFAPTATQVVKQPGPRICVAFVASPHF
jgi:hypothetical protein